MNTPGCKHTIQIEHGTLILQTYRFTLEYQLTKW
jgi:hypothetical protein